MATAAVIDANLLLAYVVGKKHPEQLGRAKHVKAFMPEDLPLLERLLSGYRKLIVTPDAVTECSDLLSDSADFDYARNELKTLLENKLAVAEEYVPSVSAAGMPQYNYLGIADCTMLSLIDDDVVLLSTDGRLLDQALRKNPACVNFNHFRNFT